MAEPDSDRVQEIFSKALQRPTEERAAFIEQECRGDEALRAQIEDLLNALSDAGEFMKDPTVKSPPRPTPGDTIDNYKLLQQLGEGGFGVVYLAEQEMPVRRKVALKIIKLGMDTKQVIARFEAERQALAMMDHPNIAKVLDGGTTDTGRPYFVMELVKGDPITDYCDREGVTLRDRLDLFIATCQAVQHAHQKGIIHRDIKPSNVMITLQDGKPVPKVIDFGIAKATAARLTEQTVFTEIGQFIGTPEYMSPEQAERTSMDIDTRSDVYSLGVLLYELLTGTTPFEPTALRRAGLAEIQRIIREDDPPRPSTRLNALSEQRQQSSATPIDAATIAAESRSATDVRASSSSLEAIARQRRTDPRTLSRFLRGDLDWIIMKALEKDRTRRYDTANGFAADIERYLKGEPVVAAPPSATYRMRKFVRRNKAGMTAAGLVAAVLVLGVAGTTWGMVWALDEKERADQRAKELDQVAEFQAEQLSDIDPGKMGLDLRNGLLSEVRIMLRNSGVEKTEIVSRIEALDRSLAGADFAKLATSALKTNVFDRALSTIDDQFGNQPLVQARLLQSLAVTLRELTMLEDAVAPQERALALRRRELGNEHLDTLRSIHERGWLHNKQGDFEQADAAFRTTLNAMRSKLGDDHPETIKTILATGENLQFADRLDEAEPYLREAVETSGRVLGNEHPTTLLALKRLGTVLIWQGEFDEAERCLEEVLQASRRRWPNGSREAVDVAQVMGLLLERTGRLAEAKLFHEEDLERNRRLFGGDHGYTIVSSYNYATYLYRAGELEESVRVLGTALPGYRRVYGPDHWRTLLATQFMGVLLNTLGQVEEAEAHFRTAAEGLVDALGPEHTLTIDATCRVAGLLNEQERYTEAEAFLRIALEHGIASGNQDSWRRYVFHSLLGESLRGLGRLAEAEPILLEAYEGLEPPPVNAVKKTRALQRIIDLYDAWDEAEPDGGYQAKAEQWRAKLADASD